MVINQIFDTIAHQYQISICENSESTRTERFVSACECVAYECVSVCVSVSVDKKMKKYIYVYIAAKSKQEVHTR